MLRLVFFNHFACEDLHGNLGVDVFERVGVPKPETAIFGGHSTMSTDGWIRSRKYWKMSVVVSLTSVRVSPSRFDYEEKLPFM